MSFSPRYILLLKELLKQASNISSSESITKSGVFLLNAIKKLEESAAQINESIRSRENGEIMAQLQKEIGDSIVLFSPGRTFIKRGKLFKLSSSWTPSSTEREGRSIEFLLFSDLLLYISPTFIGRDKVVEFHINNDFSVTPFKETHAKPDALPLIAVATRSRVIYIQFSSVEEESSWSKELNNCICSVWI